MQSYYFGDTVRVFSGTNLEILYCFYKNQRQVSLLRFLEKQTLRLRFVCRRFTGEDYQE